MARAHLYCHSPIALYSEYKTPWADVWIKLKLRPNKRIYFAPCIASLTNLESEIDFKRELIDKFPKHKEVYTKDLNKLLEIKEKLNYEYFVYVPLSGGCCDLYVAEPCITKSIAEKVMQKYLANEGYHVINFKWQRPKCILLQT